MMLSHVMSAILHALPLIAFIAHMGALMTILDPLMVVIAFIGVPILTILLSI